MIDTVLTFSDGKLELPQEVQNEMQLTEGSRLRLISATPTELRLEAITDPPVAGAIWLGSRWWVPNDEWRSMRGMLSGHPEHDMTKARAEERAWELEHDERKFGPFSKS